MYMRQITEYSAAALGNLAAGSQEIKDAIREAGGIDPLVSLLKEDPNEISAELSAVVLRNLSLQNPTNRAEIQVPLLFPLSLISSEPYIRQREDWIHCYVYCPQDKKRCTIHFLVLWNTWNVRPLERKRNRWKACVASTPHTDISALLRKRFQSSGVLDTDMNRTQGTSLRGSRFCVVAEQMLFS